MKKLAIVLGLVAIVLFGISIFKDIIIKSVVTAAVSRMTGAPVHMDGFSLNILSSTIRVSGFKMYNPGGFPQGILVSCPRINIIYDRASLFSKRRHFLLIEVEFSEMGLTKNAEGRLSVDALKIGKQPKSLFTPMQTDLLTLSVGKLVYKDYAGGAQPHVRVYDINSRNSYKNIPSAQQLIALVIAEPMKAAAITEAQIYDFAMRGGWASLPVAVAATFIGKDNVRQIIDVQFEHFYAVSLTVIKRMGRVTKEDPAIGSIKAHINGSMVALQLRKKADDKTEITVSARKNVFPMLDVAGGVLYQILDALPQD